MQSSLGGLSVITLFFENKKAVTYYLLLVLVSCGIAISLPILLGKNNFVFTLSGILFFAIPLALLLYSRKKFISKGCVVLNPEHIRIAYRRKDLVIPWSEIEKYVVIKDNRSIMANFYSIIIQERNGNKNFFSIVDDKLIASDNSINENSILFQFCKYVVNYNSTQTEPDKIELQASLGAKKGIKYLFLLPVALIVFDIVYRITHPGGNYSRDIGLLALSAFLALGILAKTKSENTFYHSVLKLQNSIQ
jgi:hypothetical protein